jgi:Zn finger protein HypA/HybF involved in hydrogenase expression
MALPILQTPVYTLKIPSLDKEVKIRPFLIREEKALLIAQQSQDLQVMIDTIKEIAKSCIKDNSVDIESLSIFDLEYIFTQLRARSVGEYVELYFACDECDSPESNVKLTLDLTKIQVKFDEKHNKKISLYGDVGIMMKYPNIKTLSALEKVRSGDIESIFDVVIDSIDFIYTGDEVFHAKEQTREELYEFINSLTQEQFKKLEQFFETMPKLQETVEYDCPVCKKHHDKVVEGIESFF